jgi:hypothetical protein
MKLWVYKLSCLEIRFELILELGILYVVNLNFYFWNEIQFVSFYFYNEGMSLWAFAFGF